MRTVYFTAFLLFIGISCSDEDKRLSPSYKDTNWFIIEDSDDEIEHLRYCIYKKTQISIYNNNKLGEQIRGKDAFGDEVIHKEILEPEYWITRSDNLSYTFLRKREDIKNGIVFVQNNIIENLPSSLYPRSILLVKDLYERKKDDKWRRNVYLRSMSLVISNIGKLTEMTNEEKKQLALEASTLLWYKHIEANYTLLLSKFYTVSENSVIWPSQNLDKKVYNRYVHPDNDDFPHLYIPFKPHWNNYGFLICHPEKTSESGYYFTPTKEQDLRSFISTVLNYDQSEFTHLYKDKEGYNFLLEKYQLIKSIIEEIKAKNKSHED